MILYFNFLFSPSILLDLLPPQGGWAAPALRPQVFFSALQLRAFRSQTQQASGPRGSRQTASLESALRSDGSFSSFHLKLSVLRIWLLSRAQAHSRPLQRSVSLSCYHNTRQQRFWPVHQFKPKTSTMCFQINWERNQGMFGILVKTSSD